MPLSPAFIHDTQYAGRSFTEKLAAVRKEMDANGAESLLLSALDEIAWLLNIRGNDVHCNPVVVSYLLIEKTQCIISSNRKSHSRANFLF